VHTNDMLIGQCLCACVELEALFTNRRSTLFTRHYQAPRPKCTDACERVTFSDARAVVVQWSISTVIRIATKISLFQPNCRMKNYISRCFSATFISAGPLIAFPNTTQQALSTQPYRTVSSPSIPDLDEKSKNRLLSPGRGETSLNSCVCNVRAQGMSTDIIAGMRTCFVVVLERGRDP